jgi:hypothetical protein
MASVGLILIFCFFNTDSDELVLPQNPGTGVPLAFNTPSQLGIDPLAQGPGRLIMPGDEELQRVQEDDLDLEDDLSGMNSGQLKVCMCS